MLKNQFYPNTLKYPPHPRIHPSFFTSHQLHFLYNPLGIFQQRTDTFYTGYMECCCCIVCIENTFRLPLSYKVLKRNSTREHQINVVFMVQMSSVGERNIWRKISFKNGDNLNQIFKLILLFCKNSYLIYLDLDMLSI